MRVAIGGKGWVAVRAARLIEALAPWWRLDLTIEVVGNRDDPGHDTWLPSLIGLAADRGWCIHGTAEAAGLGRGDVLLSLQHDRVVDCAALKQASAFNLHFAQLPRYRGSLTAAWPIRNGDRAAGVTLHELSPVVDGGPVIASRTFELPTFYTAFDLYRAHHAFGFELLKDHVESLLRGSYTAVSQDDTKATVVSRHAIGFSDVALRDFGDTADRVRDRCRSLIFPPRQYPTFRGRLVQACFSVDTLAPSLPPGSVVGETSDCVLVACRTGVVCLEYRLE